MKKYKRGFILSDPTHRILDQEWLYQGDKSDDKKLVFYGYDANLCPLPNLSSLNFTSDWLENLKKKALHFTKDFDGEVWLDDVRIK